MENNGIILLIIILTIFLLFSTLIFLDFSFGNEAWAREAQEIKPVGTLDEAKEKGDEIVKEAQEKIPGIMKNIWEREVRPVWQKMWDWGKSWWENRVFPWLSNIFQERVKPSLEKEIEKKKPIVEQELEKEKEEIKKEAPEVGKSLWQRFKGLFE